MLLSEAQLVEMLEHDEDADLWLLAWDSTTGEFSTLIVPGDDEAALERYMDPSSWPRFICKSLTVNQFVRAYGIEKALAIVNDTIEKTITRPSSRNPAASFGAMAGRLLTKRMGV